ncbi:hypothetical protein HELRODRAFT_162227 [Helobdella robusta]|uniref:Protein kinase domain-containing protein n=1 Tax=Helobdella robusta TaxID=6412 RepID=T1ESD7_HELRO|nr:hypothetical protein HELRODRAFT_162227 [Helobdella robusta]ESN98771.1 hypothetical protein HELRODRAFT_162227 [Helobdella robusta]
MEIDAACQDNGIYSLSEARNEEIKRNFLEIYKKFIDEVEPNCILDWLIQERVLNIEEKERISSQPTRHEKCRVLLDKLFMTSNKMAFILVYKVLYQDYNWLAKDIDDSINKERKCVLPAPNELQHKLNAANATIADLQTVLKLKDKNILDLENRLSKMKEKLEQLEQRQNKVKDMSQFAQELNAKTEEIQKLESHINILQDQIKNAASMNKSSDALDANEHFSDAPITDDTKKQKSLTRKIKLVNYSGSSFDLWQGTFGSCNKLVMIKDLLDNTSETHISNFIKETEILKQLNHPRLCNLLNSSTVGSNYYMVFEGTNLPNALTVFKCRTFPVDGDDILRWVVQLACGLDYLHSHLILHRNVYIQNIILHNGLRSIKLFNFSYAKQLKTFQDTIVEENQNVNAKSTAPEVILRNEWSLKSDVWLFGMTALKIYLRGCKLFPGMTQRDIKNYMSRWTAEEFDKQFCNAKNFRNTNRTHLKRCLEHECLERPDMLQLCYYSCYVENLVPRITTLKNILYVIVVSSSSIKCFKKSNKFQRIQSIKLGQKKSKSLTNFIKLHRTSSSSSFDSSRSSIKQITYSSNVLTSIASSEYGQCIYVLDGFKKIIFQISADKRRIINCFEACPGAHSLSVTADNNLLLNCRLDENFILECNNSGQKTRIINTEFPDSEPRKAIKLNDVQYLFFHKLKNVRDDVLTVNVVDNDGIPSSGYGKLCLKNISDVAIHRPSRTIFLTDYNANKVMFIDQYMNSEPREILNTENGIFNPVKIYVSDEGQIFVGLISGTIRFFQFHWK